MNMPKPNLRIKIPDFYCSKERIAKLKKGLPYGWTVEMSHQTDECVYYNYNENIYSDERPEKDEISY